MEQATKHCTAGTRHLGIRLERQGGRTRRRHGLLRRRADAGDAAAVELIPSMCRSESPRRQRRELDEAAAPNRAPARPVHRDFDALFTKGQADVFAFPRLSVADSSLDLPAHNHKNIHVRGYRKKARRRPRSTWSYERPGPLPPLRGRIDRLPILGAKAAYFKQAIHEKLSSTRIHRETRR